PDASVAIMSGATEIDFVQSEGVDEGQIETVSDIPATFSAVESGRADATTGTEMTIKMALESAGEENLEFVEHFEQPPINGVRSLGTVTLHPNNEEQVEDLNEKLAELKEDGTFAQILEQSSFSEESNMVEYGTTAEIVCSEEVYEQ